MINRRTLLLAISAGASGTSHSQPAWPQRPVRIIVPGPPGGGLDAASRMLADQLRSVWTGNGMAIVDNRPGGNTIIGAAAALSAPRDGYTLFATINVTRQLPLLGQKLQLDPAADFVPISPITTEQLLLVVNTVSQIQDFAGLVALAKSKPTGLNFGTFGIATLGHLAALQIAAETKVSLTPVHYRGSAPAVQDLLGNQVDAVLSNMGTVEQHIRSGRLRAIAQTGAQRYRFAPDVPTLKELGVRDLEFVSWTGMFAPKGVPEEILQKLGRDIRTALKQPALAPKFNAFFQEPGQMSMEEFSSLVRADDALAEKLIRKHQVRLE